MYELVSFLRRSRIKRKILKILLSESMTAVDLKKELNIHRESASRALLDMEKKGLVKCITPNEHHFRYYGITEKGKELIAFIEKK